MEQRSEEWFAARCGKVTASRVADIIAKTKIRAKRQPRELPCPTGLRALNRQACRVLQQFSYAVGYRH
jgi:hypothetical protein